MKNGPPKWADRFLEWFCNPDLLEDIQGDLYEIYDEMFRKGKGREAQFLFVWHVFRSFRYSVIARKLVKDSLLAMTRNNFKIAFRVLWREKFNSSLNMIGLSIGIACFFLMGSYVKQELSYDKFHSKSDRIQRVWLKEDYGDNKVFFNSVTPLRFESLLKENFSEFEDVVQINMQNYLVGETDDRDNENVAILSPTFFEVFDFKVTHGNLTQPLPSKNHLILSQSYAKKYFGGDEAIGQTLPIQIGEEIKEFTISALFKDIRKESSVQFDMAISNEINADIYSARSLEAWFNVAPETYVLLGEKSDIKDVETKMQDVVMTYLEGKVERDVYNIGFQPITDIHLNAEIPQGLTPIGNKDYVYMLGAICLLVLIVACINYTTLSVGQSIRRGKEVGVRKVLGAFKMSLINQYLSESLLITTVAMLVAIGISIVALPAFNNLTGADVVLNFQPWQIFACVGLVVTIGVASGIYPAFILSRLQTVKVLKGGSQSRGNHLVRKGMVVLQFSITVFLISSTLIIQSQLNFMQSKDLGFNYDATVSVPLYPDPAAPGFAGAVSSTMEKGEILKERLSQYPSIQDIGMGSHVFGTTGWGEFSFTDETETFRNFVVLITDATYFSTFDIKMVQGNKFDPESELDRRQSVILNQAAVDYFGFDDPIGETLPGSDFGAHNIIGVTENFNYSSLHTGVDPLVIVQNVAPILKGISDLNFEDSPIPKLVFRYQGSQLLEVKNILEEEWKTTFPNEELRFSFVEENMRFQYEDEARLNKLVIISSILSLIIASLGLLGLAVLVTNSRTKEISIRKIIGASDKTIFGMLVRGFAVQLLLGVALSIPITYLIMSDWLKGFAFKIEIGAGVFITSALISLAIALLVISFHTMKAAMNNPADSIRSE